ncbi:hypothetical protein GCM10017673_55810 [Streptosporangium violaceochromogenes]|nr:hypothetical protein GCM10017673_55810 [Streptosporangium violaceochromogenes]
MNAWRGEYVDRNAITVTKHLPEWIEGNAVEIKPRTFNGHRVMIRLCIVPRIDRPRFQALRSATSPNSVGNR